MATHSTSPNLASDLAASSKLVIEAVQAVTHIVEGMHSNIARLSPPLGKPVERKTSGITGFVYRSVRGITQVVGTALSLGISQLEPLLRGRAAVPQREALLSAINGVLGDHLQATDNPLAIPMQLRQNAAPVDAAAQTGGKLLVAVHGLCMNDQQWLHGEGMLAHNHATALARDLGYTPVYLHYNTGLAIAENGEQFAQQLQQLVDDWPVPITELSVLCHSMGGLVSRSALQIAKAKKHTWPHLLKHLVFLGTPHHGAPLERAGSWIDYALGISPYSAPLAKLGLLRSQGIQDLRHGRVWRVLADEAAAFGLPARVKCHAVAATRQKAPLDGTTPKRLKGDGLVPVASALGQHREAEKTLKIPKMRQLLVFDTDHFELLNSREVYEYLVRQMR